MAHITNKDKRALLLAAAKDQLLPSAIVLVASLICAGLATGGYVAVADGSVLSLLLAIPLTLLALFLLYLSGESFISSTRYYYESALNRKYGRYFSAEVADINSETFTERRRINGEYQVVDSHTLLYITTHYQGQPLTVEYELPEGREELTDKLKPGMTVTFRMVPGMPATLRIAPQKLTRQLTMLADAAGNDQKLSTPS